MKKQDINKSLSLVRLGYMQSTNLDLRIKKLVKKLFDKQLRVKILA